MRGIVTGFLSAVWLIFGVALAGADDLEREIAEIASAGPQGQGSDAARRACRDLSHRGPEVLPRLLVAMDTPNIVAANWYRAAYERIVAREFAKPHSRFPLKAVETYVREPNHQGRARRLALELLDRVEPSFGKALIPTLLDDPEFRDDAIAAVLKRGEQAETRGQTAAAKGAYQTAFQHARNASQVTRLAAKLESLGEHVSIVEHLGFVRDWYLIGPFPAPGMSGFRASFPPERSVDLSAPVLAVPNETRRWSRHQTNDPFGTVDLVRALGPVDEAVGYAYTELASPGDRDVELRSSADDNLTVWLNGKKVLAREMWLNGTRLDRFITPVHLRAGRNRVLVKICQSPHHRDPSVGNAWTFQLRFCSSDGAGVGLRSLLPPLTIKTSGRSNGTSQ